MINQIWINVVENPSVEFHKQLKAAMTIMGYEPTDEDELWEEDKENHIFQISYSKI